MYGLNQVLFHSTFQYQVKMCVTANTIMQLANTIWNKF